MEQVYYIMENVRPKLHKPSECWVCHSKSITRMFNNRGFRCQTCGKIL